jgi:hypothetical protein
VRSADGMRGEERRGEERCDQQMGGEETRGSSPCEQTRPHVDATCTCTCVATEAHACAQDRMCAKLDACIIGGASPWTIVHHHGRCGGGRSCVHARFVRIQVPPGGPHTPWDPTLTPHGTPRSCVHACFVRVRASARRWCGVTTSDYVVRRCEGGCEGGCEGERSGGACAHSPGTSPPRRRQPSQTNTRRRSMRGTCTTRNGRPGSTTSSTRTTSTNKSKVQRGCPCAHGASTVEKGGGRMVERGWVSGGLCAVGREWWAVRGGPCAVGRALYKLEQCGWQSRYATCSAHSQRAARLSQSVTCGIFS